LTEPIDWERKQRIRRIREDEAHRSVGHYIFAFAYLVSEMREAVEYVLSREDPEADRMNAMLAMGASLAEQITNAFFAICERAGELDEEEARVAGRLKKEAKDAITDRNDFAHGDWSNLWPNQGPLLRRMKPGRKAGAQVERVRPVEEIDALAEKVELLADTITEFAECCLGVHQMELRTGTSVRVRDIFQFRKQQVFRAGRYADVEWRGDEEEPG
jgi:hypothetical protein